jgi:hypothetical protein
MIYPMKKAKVIYVTSIQHTGTWFLLDMLACHPDVDGLCESRLVRPGDTYIFPGKTTILHKHIPMSAEGEVITLEQDRLLNVPHLAVIDTYKTLIPLRDPLLSIITRQSRHPDLTHTYLVHGFLHLTDLEKHPNVFFVPIDTDIDLPQKRRLLRSACLHIDIPERLTYIRRYAESWPVSNSFSYTEQNKSLKGHYYSRDIPELMKTFPQEIKLLREKEGQLRPFLEKHGYKNLPWWS